MSAVLYIYIYIYIYIYVNILKNGLQFPIEAEIFPSPAKFLPKFRIRILKTSRYRDSEFSFFLSCFLSSCRRYLVVMNLMPYFFSISFQHKNWVQFTCHNINKILSFLRHKGCYSPNATIHFHIVLKTTTK